MFTEEEWDEAFMIAAGIIPPKKRDLAPGYVETVEIVNGRVSGKAPFVNLAVTSSSSSRCAGRLAMIAFVAAFGAEKAGAGPILQQFESSMVGVGLTFVLLTVASCISIQTAKSQSVGPFQPSVMYLLEVN